MIGEDSLELQVSSFNPEFQSTRADPTLMASVSRAGGGVSGPADSLAAVLDAMDFPDEIVVETREIELRHLPVMLIAVILLLAAEWFVRRRKGML